MSFPYKRRIVPLAVLTATLALDTAVAHAAQLEEVIVTARKRQESIQDAPIVVNVVTEKTIKAYNIDSVDNLSTLVPGLFATADTGSGSTPQISIRGIQSGSINIANDQAVSVNLDGIQFSNSAILRAGTFDLASAEVLKGPQALFFGKNSPGGIISLRTADPTAEFFAEISAGYEVEADTQNYTGIISGPISNNVSGRLAAQFTSTDGHFTNEHPDSEVDKALFYDETMLRATLQAEYDSTLITGKITYTDRDGGANQFGQRFVCADPAGLAAISGTDCTLNDTFSSQDPIDGVFADRVLFAPNADRYRQADPFAESQMLASSLEVETELNDNWTFTSLSGFNRIDTHDFTSLIPGENGIFILERDAALDSFSQEIRFLGDYDTMRLMFGAFYDDRKVQLRQMINIVGFQYPSALQVQDSNAYSFFGQVEVDFTEQLSLSVGARYIDEEKSLRGENLEGGVVLAGIGQIGPALAFNTPVGPYTYATNQFSNDNLSPEVTLSYTPSNDTLFYATYKEGFKSGGFDYGSTSNPLFSHPRQTLIDGGSPIERSFRPETVEGFELGVKTEFADNTIRLNAALFSYEYNDLQVAVFDPELVIQRTLNAAAATTEGAEVELTYATPVEGLTLISNLAYVKAEYDDFLGPCNAIQLGGGDGGCTIDVTGDDVGDVQDRSGQPLVRAPELVFDLGANYETSLSDSLMFRSDLRATWTDEFQTESRNDPRAIQDAYINLNLSVGIAASDESWAIDLIGTNLTDETVLIGAAARDGANADLYGSRNVPREIMLRLTYQL